MFKTIITPENNSVQINLPKEYVGKEVEIIAHLKTQPVKKNRPVKGKRQNRLNKLQQFYKTYNYDLSHYKFNRDELNER